MKYNIIPIPERIATTAVEMDSLSSAVIIGSEKLTLKDIADTQGNSEQVRMTTNNRNGNISSTAPRTRTDVTRIQPNLKVDLDMKLHTQEEITKPSLLTLPLLLQPLEGLNIELHHYPCLTKEEELKLELTDWNVHDAITNTLMSFPSPVQYSEETTSELLDLEIDFKEILTMPSLPSFPSLTELINKDVDCNNADANYIDIDIDDPSNRLQFERNPKNSNPQPPVGINNANPKIDPYMNAAAANTFFPPVEHNDSTPSPPLPPPYKDHKPKPDINDEDYSQKIELIEREQKSRLEQLRIKIDKREREFVKDVDLNNLLAGERGTVEEDVNFSATATMASLDFQIE